MPTQIIDLSALYWRNWHASDGDEVSSARRKTIGFVRSLYGGGDVIVALDSPPYKRKQAYPEYKANRPERNEAAIQQLEQCQNEILEDGWKSAYAPGYEADDVIYTLVQQHKDAVVYGTDKDLLQCCDIKEPWSGKIKTPEETLKVKRDQVVDYLTLWGDTSDKITCVKGIGEKTAADMLREFDDISGIYSALYAEIEIEKEKKENGEEFTPKFKPKTRENLIAALEYIDKTRELIQLQDCSESLCIEQINKEEQPVETAIEPTVEPEVKPEPQSTAITVQHEQVGFRQSLEPIGINECYRISEAFYQSRLYSKFPTPQSIMVTIMRGRALGLDATTALDGIDVIQGKPCMKASLMVGLVLASPKCEYLYCQDSVETSATWRGKRVGMPDGVDIGRKFTIEDAQRMQLTGKDNWKKQPATMLKWRAASQLIRELFPDVINGLYATEEME